MAGWNQSDISSASSYDALPDAVRAYSEALVATMPGSKLSYVGVGRDRSQLIKL